MLLLSITASPQATTNEIYVMAAQTGQENYQYQTVRIDAPLTLTKDSLGVVHLGTGHVVTDEVPQYQAPSNTWTLAHSPLVGTLECQRNGIIQTRTPEPGHLEFVPEYSITGNSIASPFWGQLNSDGSVEIHRCRYSW